MRVRRKVYGEKEKKYFLGMHEKKYSKTGLVQIPKKFVRSKEKFLYCVKVKENFSNSELLRCFYSFTDMEEFVTEYKNESDYQIGGCSKHLILPLLHYIRLPKGFYNVKMDMCGQQLRYIGVCTCFEIWKEADYMKVSQQWETTVEDIEEELLNL